MTDSAHTMSSGPAAPSASPRRAGIDIRRWLTRLSLITSTVALSACHAALLDPKGPVGQAEKVLLIDSLAIMLAIVVPTIIMCLAVAWWFRASNKKAVHLPDWEFSGRVEMVVWGIPLMTIILLGGVTWIAAHELDPAVPLPSKHEALEVQVVSLDWKWLFIYPKQGVAAVNQLTLPAGVPVHFSITSSSVMNTFFVPELGSMIYSMNGMTTQLNLQADEPGVFHGLSGHYSGEGFADMHFEVHAVPAAEFATWVDSTRTNGRSLDTAEYNELAKQSIAVAPSTYRTVAPDLFQKIVSLELAPGPGPETAHEGATGKPEIKP